jgi:putative SOS response-associated peptidase YedK
MKMSRPLFALGFLMYRLTLGQPAVNTRARYNVCPTTTIDMIVGPDGKRELVPMRWGLIPSWWSKAAQGNEARHVQRAGRDGSDKADVSIRV